MEEYGIECERYDFGFIAPELEQVLPELVREGADSAHLALNHDHITAINSATIKALISKIDAFESKNAEFHVENAELKKTHRCAEK